MYITIIIHYICSMKKETIEKYIKLCLEKRKFLGWSQSELCKITGINRNSLSLFENNKLYPKVSTLRLICSALNVKIDEKEPS